MFRPYAAKAWRLARIRTDGRWPVLIRTRPTPGICDIFCANRVSAISATSGSGSVFDVSASVRIGASAGFTFA